VAAVEADRRQHLVQQLPGPSDEGQALAIFVGARRLADDHDVGVGIAVGEDELRCGRLEPAAFEREELRPQFFERPRSHRGIARRMLHRLCRERRFG